MNGMRLLYCKELPSFLEEYVQTEAMQRIKGIDMNCGMNYTSFPLFAEAAPYSRLEHSIRTALLLSRFTDSRKIILSGLFHDIATPAFSHVIDFVNGDYQNQESTENETYRVLAGDKGICALLERDGIQLQEVADYHLYPLADNDSPKLSADRLEYTLGNLVNYGFGTMEDVSLFLNDLHVEINEDGEEEMAFRTKSVAERFGLFALQCGHVYSCNEDRYGMEYLARLLKKAVRNGILEYDDFRNAENEVIGRLCSSPLKEEWLAFTQMKSLLLSSEEKEGWLQVHAKRRYIDPLCQGKRVSSFSEIYRNRRAEFLCEDQDLWMKADNIEGETKYE